MNRPNSSTPKSTGDSKLDRRELLAYTAAFGSAFMAAQGLASAEGAEQPAPKKASEEPRKRYPWKKSINLWALPYPDKMSLRDCFEICKNAGFDAVEVNYALEGELSPEADEQQIREVGQMARKIGIEISGLCSFLFWPYALTAADPERRKKGLELALQMIRAARLLGTENLLVVPGAVYIPWMKDVPPVPPDVCDRRARQAMRTLVPEAEKHRIYLNIENIFINGYLHDPAQINAFVDSFDSEFVRVHFDTGNCMQYHFPEHWVLLFGNRIKNIHLKEHNKNVGEFNLHTFRPLLDGTTNWPAVLEALDKIGYEGYLTFEYFNPFQHHPESLVYFTSDAMDRMLGRKA